MNSWNFTYNAAKCAYEPPSIIIVTHAAYPIDMRVPQESSSVKWRRDRNASTRRKIIFNVIICCITLESASLPDTPSETWTPSDERACPCCSQAPCSPSFGTSDDAPAWPASWSCERFCSWWARGKPTDRQQLRTRWSPHWTARWEPVVRMSISKVCDR